MSRFLPRAIWPSAGATGRTGRPIASALSFICILTVLGFAPVPGASGQVLSVPNQKAITVTLNIPGQVPTGVSDYRVDLTCRGLEGITGGTQTVTLLFGIAGGTQAVLFPLQVGSNCTIRVAVRGTGPRTLIGNAITIGGLARFVQFLDRVDGQPVDLGTVFETSPIPVEGPTTVLIGSVPSPTTTTSSTTTVVAATTTSTTTTPATTTPATTTPATTISLATTTRPPITVPATVLTSSTTLTAAPGSTTPTPPSTRATASTAAPRTRLVRRCTTVRGRRTCRLVRVTVR